MIGLNASKKMDLIDLLSTTGVVVLSIDASLLQKNNSGRHAVTYVSGSHTIYVKDGLTYHKFKVQSWGDKDGWDIDISENELGDKIYKLGSGNDCNNKFI